uniref:Coatomer subunit zeta n=1 Tax=Neobodo designis TaxID=312471 RepID=A0A7S1R586_NEODS|mmetsp:Transcript_88/g.309  ORF Transcript_88/g.309 Transcript_88/m.309 type:complete len:185 (+) Transcript_88:52-606(+)|eukprot:CAMPEP_0174851118 /NCGR_PEP_ID=MMETSP1114-20130205/21708_1 /TAXON_ID=312471 /ORGANISM="Neobodo designis, Strain CCAP 1951/1" /LENGTH=184 /DNA_ID=CAMNT_0016085631 /DNA_START=52 /DNA_END=606 /DNA_ORIENTATION=+
MDCLHQVWAVVILDAEGQRVFAKYYNSVVTGEPSKWATVDSQRALEKALHNKTRTTIGAQTDSETVLIYEGATVVYVVDPELSFLVIGPNDENELVLNAVLTCVYEGMQMVLKTTQPLDKRQLLEAYEALILVVDETVDDGIVFETNPASVAGEVAPFAVPENQAADQAKKAIRSFKGFLERNT